MVLILSLWQREPASRPSAIALLGHRFFRQARDKAYIVKNLLQGEHGMTLMRHVTRTRRYSCDDPLIIPSDAPPPEGLPLLPERVSHIVSGSIKAATSTPENHARLVKSMERYINDVAGWDFEIHTLPHSLPTQGTAPADAASVQESSPAPAAGPQTPSLPLLAALDHGSVVAISPGEAGGDVSKDQKAGEPPVPTLPSLLFPSAHFTSPRSSTTSEEGCPPALLNGISSITTHRSPPRLECEKQPSTICMSLS